MTKNDFELFLSDSLKETLEVCGPEEWSRFIRDLFFGWFESSSSVGMGEEEHASICWRVQRLVKMFDEIQDRREFANQLPVKP